MEILNQQISCSFRTSNHVLEPFGVLSRCMIMCNNKIMKILCSRKLIVIFYFLAIVLCNAFDANIFFHTVNNVIILSSKSEHLMSPFSRCLRVHTDSSLQLCMCYNNQLQLPYSGIMKIALA